MSRAIGIHDRRTEVLLSNGDIPVWTNQRGNEHAKNLDIWPPIRRRSKEFTRKRFISAIKPKTSTDTPREQALGITKDRRSK